MANKTSSDDIKATLAEKFGGAAKDWERLTKKKNAENAVVREFRQKTTNLYITVTDTDAGPIYIRRNISVPPAGTLPAVDHDPARVAAAKSIIKRTVFGEEGLMLDDLPESLLKKAGDLAYANQFLFAIVSTEENKYRIYVASKVLFEEEQYHNDDVCLEVGHILPRYTNDPRGGNFHECACVPDDRLMKCGILAAPALIDAAREMLGYGFFWNEAYQKAAEEHAEEPNLFNAREIAALLLAPTLPSGTAPSP